MAKNKEEKPEIKVEKPEKKPSFFPKLTILFGFVLIAIAALGFFGVFQFSKLAIEIILLLAGLWLLKLGLERGLYKKRKEILKKYI